MMCAFDRMMKMKGLFLTVKVDIIYMYSYQHRNICTYTSNSRRSTNCTVYMYLDSSSETREDGGGGMVLEDAGISVQIQLTSEGITVEEKGTMYSDCHELAGAGQTSPIDYTLQQSQLVGKQSHQSLHTWSETAGIKHYLLANGSSITVTTNELIANLVCIYK